MACDEFSKVLCGANHDPVAFRCRSLRCAQRLARKSALTKREWPRCGCGDQILHAHSWTHRCCGTQRARAARRSHIQRRCCSGLSSSCAVQNRLRAVPPGAPWTIRRCWPTPRPPARATAACRPGLHWSRLRRRSRWRRSGQWWRSKTPNGRWPSSRSKPPKPPEAPKLRAYGQ